MSVLITQSFGKDYEYRRAILAIWSYWLYCPHGKVLLFTDAPSYFEQYFEGKPIQYFVLTPSRIKEMRGSIDFLHRMKIAILEEAFKQTGEDLLYVDSDTFFINDPGSVLAEISDGISFMHLREYRFDSLSEMKLPAALPFHAFLDLIKRSRFRGADNSDLKVTPHHYSWNAGVMMLHKSVSKLLPDVYALTEQFYPETLNHASEQYAFSIVLQNSTDLRSCEAVVYHYWYRVKKQVIDIFLAERINDKWAALSVSSKEKSVREWTKTLPSYLETHVLALRDEAIQAFHQSQYMDGYKFAFRALLKEPFNMKFLRDVLYHTKILFGGKRD